MFAKKLTALLLTIQVCWSQATFKAGVKNSLDIAVIEQAKDVYFDKILKIITNLQIPDIYIKDNEDYMIGNTLVI